MELHARLIHSEAGVRLVEVRASRDGRSLGSALAEAKTVQEAEDLAIARLLQRLGEADRREETPVPRSGPAASGAFPAGMGQPDAGEGGQMPSRQRGLFQEAPAAERRIADAQPPPGRPVQAAQPARGPEASRDAPGRARTAMAEGSPLSATPAGEGAPTPARPVDEEPRPPMAAAPLQGRDGGQQAVSVAGPDPGAEPPAELQGDPQEEPPADPEDWSQELTAVDLQLRRLGWNREAEGVYLQRAFGHPSRSRLTRYNDLRAYLMALETLERGSDPAVASVPLRRSELLAQGDALLAQLGWSAEQGRAFLERELNRVSRQQLNDMQLLQFNMLLEGELLAGATPG